MSEAAVAALRSDRCAILPTDTVYGLCSATSERAVAELYAAKGRAERQPTALLASSVDVLFELLPGLGRRTAAVAAELLPGPYTLVVPNPERRFPWLTGTRPEAIGVRVPLLPDATREVVEALGAIAATSANAPGGADPRRLEDVPEPIRARCAAELDAGELPGTPSTVVDLTTDEPRVLREGAVSAAEALARVAAALA